MFTHSKVKRILTILLSILLFTFEKGLIAQPAVVVNVMVAVLPPYSSYFFDYETKTNIIINSNLSMDIGLQLTIEGNNGIVIKTRQGVIPQYITVNANIPKNLTSGEMYQYFNPDYLDFVGVSRDEVLSKGFPEGSITAISSKSLLTLFWVYRKAVQNTAAVRMNAIRVSLINAPEIIALY